MPENASTEIRALLLDGRMYERKPDGTLVPLEDRSDWTRVDAMTDEELTANAESDPDSRPYTDEEWATAAFVHPPDKVPVGLKLDTDAPVRIGEARADAGEVDPVLREICVALHGIPANSML